MSAYIFRGSVSGVHISSDDIIKTSKHWGEGNTPYSAIIQEIIYFLQIRFMLELLLHLGYSHDVSQVTVFLCNHLYNAPPELA